MSLLSPGLEAFIAVARTRTVHAAARELGISQTGVTQRIRKLEESLSATLFLRSRKGMMLTSEGEALQRYCQAARELEGEALARLGHRRSGSAKAGGPLPIVRVRITGPSSILRSRVVPQTRAVLARRPELAAHYDFDDLESRADRLRSGQAQLAILPRTSVAREMDSKLLRPEKYVLVGPVSWKRRQLEDLLARERIVDFDPTDNATFDYLRRCSPAKGPAPREDRHFVNNLESLAELFEAGAGYGVLAMEQAGPLVKAGKLSLLNGGAVYENEVALAWYPRPEMAGYFRDLIDAIH